MGIPALGHFDEEDLRRIVRWSGSPPSPMQESTLSTKESALLDLLRERTGQKLTASEVMDLSPLREEETVRSLASLIASGVLELCDPAAVLDEELAATRDGKHEVSPPVATPAGGFPEKLGRFEVEHLLGRGSMGAVLLAQDPAIGRVVAIKLIQSASHLMPSQRERYHDRFYREASAAGRLHHPSIAAVYDVGHLDDGTPFIVMEYVAGRTLRDVLETETLSVEQTLQITHDVLDALSYAHSQGIVHRDIKPSNIIITPDLRAKIMDFGIAHVVGSEITAGDEVLGSPSYMAPEQLSKGRIDQRTDLFSFAVVLYRILTGKLPFTGDSFAAVALAILHEEPEPLKRIAPSVPGHLATVVTQCLSKDPADRYPDAESVQRALTSVEIHGEPEPIAEREAAPQPGAATPHDRWLSVSIALLIGGFLVLQLLAMGREPTSPSTPENASPTAASPTLEGPPLPLSSLTPPAAGSDAGIEPDATASSPIPAQATPTPAAPAPKSQRPRGVAQPVSPPATPTPTVIDEIENGSNETDEAKPPVPVPSEPTPAELFYAARLAVDRGEVEQSRDLLERLLHRDPTFSGAADLHVAVTDQIWERTLPRRMSARHAHRLGGCDGELSLAGLGVRFVSKEHDWAFAVDDIRVLERPDAATFVVETFEKDIFSLGKNKRYKFDLEDSLSDDDWTRYERLIR